MLCTIKAALLLSGLFFAGLIYGYFFLQPVWL
jgi:hypothetical protein